MSAILAETECPGLWPGFSFVILPIMDILTPEDLRKMLPELGQIHAQLDAIEAAEQARHESLMEQLQASHKELQASQEELSATLRSHEWELTKLLS